MSADWQKDKVWSDRFVPEIKAILGLHLIGSAPETEDRERNTDLIVLRMEAVRIACRIREFSYWQSYPGDFTIRSRRPSGAKTELRKIVEGWGDYFFYGFADPQGQKLHAWTLGNLRVFRSWFNGQCYRYGGTSFDIRRNGDGSSEFMVFKTSSLPRGFVIAQHNMPDIRATA